MKTCVSAVAAHRDSRTSASAVLSYSAAEAARVIGVSRSTVYLMMEPDATCRPGLPHLRTFKIGRSRRVSADAARELIANLEREAA